MNEDKRYLLKRKILTEKVYYFPCFPRTNIINGNFSEWKIETIKYFFRHFDELLDFKLQENTIDSTRIQVYQELVNTFGDELKRRNILFSRP